MPQEKLECAIDHSHFVATAESFRVFIPLEKGPQGDPKKRFIPAKIRRIVVNCKRSGASFKFSGTARKGILTFSDSRATSLTVNSMRPTELQTELSRMMGADNAARLMQIVLD